MSTVIMKVTKFADGLSAFEGAGTPVELLSGLSVTTESLMEALNRVGSPLDRKAAADTILYAAKLGIEHWLEKHQNCGG